MDFGLFDTWNAVYAGGKVPWDSAYSGGEMLESEAYAQNFEQVDAVEAMGIDDLAPSILCVARARHGLS